MITKIILLAIASSFLCYYLKSINSNLFAPAVILSGLMILGYSFEYFSLLGTFFNDIFELLNFDKSLFGLLIKVCLIGYMIEFSAGIIEDFGIKSLADKVVFVGKILLLCLSLPVIEFLLNTLIEFIN